MGLEGYDVLTRMEFHRVPGVSVAVLQGGGVVNAFAAGRCSGSAPDPVTIDTLFQVASVTKPLVAILAMKQAEIGAFDLDTPVHELLTRWQLPDNEFTRKTPVTVRHLLAHTAGLDVVTFPGYLAGAPLPTPIQVLAGKAPSKSAPVCVLWEPGTRFHYSSGAYVLLQVLLEDVTKLPLEALMHQDLFQPLQMNHSTLVHSPPSERFSPTQISSAHDHNGVAENGGFRRYPEQAAASLWSTPIDLARVAVEMQKALAGRPTPLLKPESARQMRKPHLEPFFGLGFALWEKGGSYFGHTGTTCGFRSLFIAHAENDLGAVVLTNSANGERMYGEIINTIAHRYGWGGFHW